MSHIQVVAEEMGVRVSGSETEALAAGYAARYLETLGYAVVTSEVLLPGEGISHNVQALKAGASPSVILVGGHIDSKAPSPGANDNASGVAVVLELARDLRDADIAPTVEFVLFGAEEMVDSNADHHHYGSRQFVQGMTAEERLALVAMVSVDMVAYGDQFLVRDMRRGPSELTDLLLAFSNDGELGLAYDKDTGAYGWSDHEPFELAGYPSAWLEWRKDPTYHTERDAYGHCDPDPVRRTGEMLLGFLAQLTDSDLALLAEARRIENVH
ncbi:MAG: Zn-dependent exopeptidase M28 [Thermoleophilia bacterium]|nr:Zn-dependent exopeptidase M28 [Thermoleophilia bacterium]